jgi:hypothetical protein
VVKIETEEIAARVTVEYMCALCGKIEQGDQIELQPRTNFESFGLPKGWTQVLPWAAVCPEHGKIEGSLTKDGELFQPEKTYFFGQENYNV